MTINETDWNVDEALDAPDYVDQEDVDEINLIDDPAVPSVEVGDTEAPTRHDFSHDSRDRIKSLKGMVGHPVPDDFDPHDISWVLPELGVTGAEGAEEAIESGHVVINVARELYNGATCKMPIEPRSWTYGEGVDVLTTLEAIVDMMEMAMVANQKVVVHCSMGMERSVLATVWYLVRNKRMSLDNAYSLVRSVRPIATDRRKWLLE